METKHTHTRLVITPTGPVHIGHAHIARLNRRLAFDTGGTFVYRFEDKMAETTGFKTGREEVCDANLHDLAAFGLGPTPAEDLVAHGFDGNWGCLLQGDCGLTHFWYRRLGFQEFFGVWPPPCSDEAPRNYRSVSGDTVDRVVHPFVILERAVMDVATGRNCIIRGEELLNEASAYGHYAQIVGGWPSPAQYYIPCLRREAPGTIASSAPTTAGMFLTDVMEAGRTAEELWAFLDRYVWTAGAAPAGEWMFPSLILPLLAPAPLIPEKEWQRFLKKGLK